MKVKISSGRNVEEDSSMPRRVTSETEMTAASEEYLMSCTKLAASGGNVARKRLRQHDPHECVQRRQPQHAAPPRGGRAAPLECRPGRFRR